TALRTPDHRRRTAVRSAPGSLEMDGMPDRRTRPKDRAKEREVKRRLAGATRMRDCFGKSAAHASHFRPFRMMRRVNDPQFVLDPRHSGFVRLDLAELFGNDRRAVLEIGSGKGRFL